MYSPLWTRGRIDNRQRAESPRGPTLREHRDAMVAVDVTLSVLDLLTDADLHVFTSEGLFSVEVSK